jgi:predicted dehydrogenase
MKLGIIGLKGHHSIAVDGARELKDVELVAVSDDDEKELDAFMKREPLAKEAQKYRDWRHLVEHSMLDICLLGDENGIRPEQLVELAKRKVHIVTEKPLATTLEKLAKLKQDLAGMKCRLTMLLTMRHEGKYAAMRKLVADGAVGQVCQVSAQKSYRLGERPAWQTSRERLGGTIPYIGIHALDLMHWVTGLDYTHVAAFHGRIGRPQMKETENHASLALAMTGGVSATARLDYLRPETAPTHGDDRLRVVGDAGILEYAAGEPDLSLVTTKEGPRRVPGEPSTNLFIEFVRAVREDKPSRITLEDAFYATEVVLRARQAADDKKVVEIGKREG